MHEVYIAIGSNKNNRQENFQIAITELSKFIKESRLSRIYETKAEGMEEGHEQPFLNGVMTGKTELSALEILIQLHQIEKSLGRERLNVNAHYSREIDLDLLLFNQELIFNNDLVVPHPRMHERMFVIQPLMDLNPELIIPGLNRKVKNIFRDLISINKELNEEKITL